MGPRSTEESRSLRFKRWPPFSGDAYVLAGEVVATASAVVTGPFVAPLSALLARVDIVRSILAAASPHSSGVTPGLFAVLLSPDR